MMNIQNLIEVVSSLNTMEETNQVIQAVKIARNRINGLKRVQFRVGQRVQFDEKNGDIIRGVITKINRKTIIVQEDGIGLKLGSQWRCSPSLLTVMEEGTV